MKKNRTKKGKKRIPELGFPEDLFIGSVMCRVLDEGSLKLDTVGVLSKIITTLRETLLEESSKRRKVDNGLEEKGKRL